MEFKRIITHVQPHLDEIVAIRILKKHGNQEFPGVKDAKVEFKSTGLNVENKTWQQHREEGTLLVGIGGGPFDEHPTFEEERKAGQSACLLVARALKQDTNPIYKRLIELVTESDLTRVHEFHIANRLKTRYRLNPGNPEKAISFVNEVLEDWEREQQLFVDARADLQNMIQNQTIHKIIIPGIEPLKLAVVESANYKVSAAARSLRIHVLIQKQTNGHVQIFCDIDRYPFSMRKVVAKLRQAECFYNGMTEEHIAKMTPAALEKEGKIPEAWNWFYQVPGENVLNGAESAPDTPPTKIALPMIVEIVKKHLIIDPAKNK